MKTIKTASILAAIIAVIFFVFPASSQTTYIDNGTSNTYTLGNGDSLYIRSGTFTGIINTWTSGSKITVAQNASFKPSSFSGNRSKVIVYGIAVLPSLNTNSGFGLTNYGTITVTGDAAMNGGAQTWTNNYGATITFKESMAINKDGSSFINNGTVNSNDDFYLYSNSSLINTNTITFSGNFKTSKGTVNNGGRFYSKKGITLSGSTSFTNTCRTIADNGFVVDNNNATVYNTGLIWATNSANNSFITNSGTIINGANAKMKSVTFTNYGTFTGSGYLYFTGVTTGSGSFGVAGITTDTIRVYDVTRSNPSTIFDNQWGTVRPNVKYAVFAAPDTTNSILASCSSQYASSLSGISILPITWNYFYANLINEIPVLDWSAQFDPGTYYEVQRSYDNTNFVSVATIAAETNKTIYKYEDTKADNSKQVIYYRIKGIEPTGEEKFTAIRVIKRANSNNRSVVVSPNPFTSRFSINYETIAKSSLTIRIYNNMGQMTVSKTVNATAGFNQFTITEAAQFPKGIYIVEISEEMKVISAQKIVKQ
ncbi:MAG: T9SS type A sorting domain-containing protein [Bacteroidetes bacterium]|nr:T9SS type A sorting domain-containing protein [Bacteroidota bacterium]